MKIAVRKTDGYVLNSDMFNGCFPETEFREDIYSAEDFDIYEVGNPCDVDKEFLLKRYYYKNGVLECTYYVTSDVDLAIGKYQSELDSTDYIIVKAYERSLLGDMTSTEYDYESIANSRQLLRDRINELRQLKINYPYTGI